MTVDGLTSSYDYSSNGDLTAIQYASGLKRIWTYNEMHLITGSAVYNEDDDLLASIDLTLNWNGMITMTLQPQNLTTKLLYDTSGRVISAASLGGPQFVEVASAVTNSVVKSYLFGDQVRMPTT